MANQNIIIRLILWLRIFIYSNGAASVSVRFLESNSWIFNLGSVEIAVDPVLYSPLDFGIPFLYTGKKRLIDGREEFKKVSAKSDYVLLTQGLDDHAHAPTLKVLCSTIINSLKV